MASRSHWLRVPALAPAVIGIFAWRRRRHGEDWDGSRARIPRAWPRGCKLPAVAAAENCLEFAAIRKSEVAQPLAITATDADLRASVHGRWAAHSTIAVG